MSRILPAGALACLLACNPSLHAQVPDSAQRLDDLATATSLERAGLLPWRLEVTFTLNDLDGAVQDSGTAEVHWSGKGYETIQVNSARLHGELPGNDAAFAAGTMREVYLLRQLLDQTIRPVPTFGGIKDLHVTDQKRKFGNVELDCLAVTRGKVPAGLPVHTGEAYCTEPSNPKLLRIRSESAVVMVRNRLATFQGVGVAVDNTLNYFGHVAITGHTKTLQTEAAAAPSDTSAPQPAGSNEAPLPLVPALVAAGHKTGGAIPSYPLLARQNHATGSVILAAVIDKTGRVKDLTPIFSASVLLTPEAIETVKTWTYTPYLLEGEPVEAATTITVNFDIAGG